MLRNPVNTRAPWKQTGLSWRHIGRKHAADEITIDQTQRGSNQNMYCHQAGVLPRCVGGRGIGVFTTVVQKCRVNGTPARMPGICRQLEQHGRRRLVRRRRCHRRRWRRVLARGRHAPRGRPLRAVLLLLVTPRVGADGQRAAKVELTQQAASHQDDAAGRGTGVWVSTGAGQRGAMSSSTHRQHTSWRGSCPTQQTPPANKRAART